MNILFSKQTIIIVLNLCFIHSYPLYAKISENGDISSTCRDKTIRVINDTCKGIRLSSPAAVANLITLHNTAAKGRSLSFRINPPVPSGAYSVNGKVSVKIIDEKNNGFHTVDFRYQWKEQNAFCETGQTLWSITPDDRLYKIKLKIDHGNYVYTIKHKQCKKKT